jgi:hypothetical protein
MHGYLKEHLTAFDPDEVHTLVAAFDRAWEAVQASGVVYPKTKAMRGQYSQNTLLRPQRTASVTTPDYVMARFGLGSIESTDRARSAALSQWNQNHLGHV